MRSSSLSLALILLTLLGCGSPEKPSEGSPSNSKSTIPAFGLETPFDIRVFADPGQAGSTAQIVLVTEVDIPEGSYVISALSDRDYLGKFQVIWQDSAITPSGILEEFPRSKPGWEPFDKVYTPMLMASTTLRQGWSLPDGLGPHSGKVFFVLEPQCVAYALDFIVEKEPDGWSSTYGMVYQTHPE